MLPQGQNLRDATDSLLEDAIIFHKAVWGHDFPKQIVTVDGHTVEYYNIKNFQLSSTMEVEEILIRNEYLFIHKDLEHRALHWIPVIREPARFVLTGQPGIGKTFFLFYLLLERLKQKKPTALQLFPDEFLLFDEAGVHKFSTDRKNGQRIPSNGWALADSNSKVTEPCIAFTVSRAVVVQASSPQQRRWKAWAKDNNADVYVMDVWPENEIGCLMEIRRLDIQRGKALARKWGPSARTVVKILTRERSGGDFNSNYSEIDAENSHRQIVEDAADAAATSLSTVLTNIKSLNFGEIPGASSLFFIGPNLRNRSPDVPYVPRGECATIFANALLRASKVDQARFFSNMSMHANTRSAAGWIFENYLHVRFTEKESEVCAIDVNKRTYTVPTVTNTLDSTQAALSTSKLPFYWRPSQMNFKGIDAIICTDCGVFALQATIARKHCGAKEGLNTIKNLLNSEVRNKQWYVVLVGVDEGDVMNLCQTEHDRLKETAHWNTATVCGCVITVGTECKKALSNILEGAQSIDDTTASDETTAAITQI